MSRWTAYQYVSTPKDRPADIDALLVSDGVLRGIVETKCRDLTSKDLFGRFKGRWLVTGDKLQRGQWLSQSLCVPFVGALYLIPDDTLLILSITTADGEWIPNIRWETTRTQATINGGEAERLNGFVDMTYAQKVHGFYK